MGFVLLNSFAIFLLAIILSVLLRFRLLDGYLFCFLQTHLEQFFF